MEETLMEQAASESMETPLTAPIPVKRGRPRGKRNSGFRMETPPFPVRAIWELATEQERLDAHKMGVLMLEHWLGRMTRKELGEKLNLPALRVWQMSQQALAGMVVGLMTQPKRPPRGTPMAREMKADNAELKTLRKENHELREQNRVLQDLLEVLKDLPGMPAAPKPLAGKKIRQSKTRPNHISTPNPLKQHRNMAATPQPQEG